MNILIDAVNTYHSDFFCAADEADRRTILRFIDWLTSANDEGNPIMSEEELTDENLPAYARRDIMYAIRNIENVNRRMTKDLERPTVKYYTGRASVSHRKVRA